jgi:hypothetical protein
MKLLNIITPCNRPQNLKLIEQSINIPDKYYEWIVVFDREKIPTDYYIPQKCKTYAYTQNGSVVGHAQRNFALDTIDSGYIYFNDDDTLIHPHLWENVSDILLSSKHDFISFDQANKDNTLRLVGSNIQINHIDSHNFIVKQNICKNIKFYIDKYNADGYFATDCYALSNNPIYISKILSIYNALR